MEPHLPPGPTNPSGADYREGGLPCPHQTLGAKAARALGRVGKTVLANSSAGRGTTSAISLQFVSLSWEEFDRYKLIQAIWPAESWRW